MSQLLSNPEMFSPAFDLQQQLRLEFRERKLARFKGRLEKDWDDTVTEYPWEEDASITHVWKYTPGGKYIWTPRPPQRRLRHQVAHAICNKTTVLYIPNGTLSEMEEGQKSCLSMIGDAVFHEWFQLCNPPRIDFGFYFAKPIQIVENGPSSVQEFIKLHKEICDTVTKMMEDKARIDWDNDCEGRRKRYACHNAKNFTVIPLCRAILTMLEQPKRAQETVAPSDQTLLLVRTGDEKDLSSPIDFSPLMEYASPQQRSDITSILPADSQQTKDAFAVHVPVHIAVKFLHDLQKREEAARPDLYEHLFNFQDRHKNPPLTRKVYGALPYFPENEEDFLPEVWRGDLYEDGGELGEWIQSASERVVKVGLRLKL